MQNRREGCSGALAAKIRAGAHRLHPVYAQLYGNMLDTGWGVGQDEPAEAREWWERARGLGSARASFKLAHGAWDAGDRQQGIALMREARERDPEFSVAITWLGSFLRQTGRKEEAFAMYREAAKQGYYFGHAQHGRVLRRGHGRAARHGQRDYVAETGTGRETGVRDGDRIHRLLGEDRPPGSHPFWILGATLPLLLQRRYQATDVDGSAGVEAQRLAELARPRALAALYLHQVNEGKARLLAPAQDLPLDRPGVGGEVVELDLAQGTTKTFFFVAALAATALASDAWHATVVALAPAHVGRFRHAAYGTARALDNRRLLFSIPLLALLLLLLLLLALGVHDLKLFQRRVRVALVKNKVHALPESTRLRVLELLEIGLDAAFELVNLFELVAVLVVHHGASALTADAARAVHEHRLVLDNLRCLRVLQERLKVGGAPHLCVDPLGASLRRNKAPNVALVLVADVNNDRVGRSDLRVIFFGRQVFARQALDLAGSLGAEPVVHNLLHPGTGPGP